ncbi:MAG TPA: hypothetical protein VFX09_08495, partial [Burkholderiales bacterium]|nr:hypothetical protein [Burkholderiales bacterium]
MCQNGPASERGILTPLISRGDMNVDRSWMRHAAMSCAIACGVMVAGPGMAGTAVASADLFGIDFDVLDIFDHKKKKKKSDHGAVVSAQQNVGAKKSGGLAKTSPKTAVG